MRIAVTGSHCVGKTTLVESLAARLAGHATVDEPYWQLEADGHEFAQPPSVEDFEAQLARSLAALDEAERDVVFDRCPVDVLAYLLEHEDAAGFDAADWLEPIRAAVATLDLIVLVPIEDADRIAVAGHEDAELRGAVDERLRALLIDDGLAGDVEVVTVTGDVRARTEQVLARVSR